jgi:hypothetical protein
LEAKSIKYPNLRHVLIETPDEEAFNEVKDAVPFVFQRTHREIRRLWRETEEFQVFIDDDYEGGKVAYEAFCPLAELSVVTLAAHAILVPSEAPPDPSEPWWFEAKKNHYAKQWMPFVHRLAKAHPGALPRSASAPFLDYFPLRKGGMASTLMPGVFKASSFVIKRILTEAVEQGRRATPPRWDDPTAAPPSRTDAARPVATPEAAETQDTASQVAEILGRDPRATSPEIAKQIGKDERTVRNTKAWKANQARLEEQKAEKSVRTRPLTESMMAAIPSQCDDPAEIAAARELEERISGDDAARDDLAILERRYLESVDQSQRAEYHDMSREQRKLTLEAWKLTGMP